MAFQNVYTHRKVAENAAKGCEICFKPSSSVLVTPENKDFFYICPVHLKDRSFCTAIIDQAAVEAKKKKEMEEEVARVKKEYDEKQKKKKEKEQEKEKEKEKAKGKEKDKDKDKDAKADDKDADKDETKKEDEKPEPKEEEPRVFALSRFIYLQRLEKKRQAEMAKRNRERMANPNFFPSVPKGQP